jgi:hypothetical protein
MEQRVMVESRLLDFLKALEVKVEKDRHRWEDEWCQCGKRRIYWAHEFGARWRRQKW